MLGKAQYCSPTSKKAGSGQVAGRDVVYLAEPTAAQGVGVGRTQPISSPVRVDLQRRGAVKPTTTRAGETGRPGRHSYATSNAHRPTDQRTPNRMRQICRTVRLNTMHRPNVVLTKRFRHIQKLTFHCRICTDMPYAI